MTNDPSTRADYQDLREWFRTEMQAQRDDFRGNFKALQAELRSFQEALQADIIQTKVLEGKMKVWGSVAAAVVTILNAALLLAVEVMKRG